MNAALEEIWLDFPYREMKSQVDCMSSGAPDWLFAEVVFHELMHTYVSPMLASSALMKKYKDEPPTTRYHLHVMAMEVMTLRKLNLLDRLGSSVTIVGRAGDRLEMRLGNC